MIRFRSIYGFGFATLALVCVIHPSQSIASSRARSTAEAATRAQFQPGHLYLAQGADIRSRVYRFPLRANGLPSTSPDGVLDLPFRYPGGIAIGPDGDLYVSSSGTANACKDPAACFVEAFAPGASGRAAPIRVLYVPAQPLWIAVDERGFLDVSVLRDGGGIYVYKPNASGNDQPLNRIPINAQALAATHGHVFIQTFTEVEAVRERSPLKTPPEIFNGIEYESNGLATDATQLYAEFFFQRPDGAFFLGTAIYRLDQPANPIRNVIGTGCRQSPSGGVLGYGVAVYKQFVFQQCISAGGAAGAVFAYDATKNGRQDPLLEILGGNAGVAIGP